MTIALKTGSTTATTGGTDQTFDRTNASVVNGYEYTDTAEADFFARQKVILAARQPQEQADGTYTKQKTSLRKVFPITLADGSSAFNLVRVEVEIHPESTAANLAECREAGGQMAIGSQFDSLYVAGTLPS